MVDVYSPALHQQPHKGAAQGAAVGTADFPIKVFLYVAFHFFRFLDHGRKNRVLRFVKAVIGNADHIEAALQQGDHLVE